MKEPVHYVKDYDNDNHLDEICMLKKDHSGIVAENEWGMRGTLETERADKYKNNPGQN